MSLSEFILANMEAILQEWEQYAKTIPEARHLDTQALRDHAERILEAIAKDIAEPQSAEEQEAKSRGRGAGPTGDSAAEVHAGARQNEGFSLNDMVSEYRALRASVIRLWIKDMASADRDTLYEMTRFNEGMDQALTASVAHYSGRLDRSRELFLGVLGHDLRNPLGAVMNSAQYLLHSDGLSGAQIKSASIILRSSKRLHDIISDLLDVTRTRLGQSLPIDPKPADLSTICEGVVDEARAHHPDHVLRLAAAPSLAGIWDEARLGQMLSNLIENAIRHGAPDKPVSVSTQDRGDHVTLSVHNEGPPIPEAARSRIFEPLRQEDHDTADPRKAGGLGLGLHVAKAIAEAHGGCIDVQSSKDAGTIFTARLPRGCSRRGSAGE